MALPWRARSNRARGSTCCLAGARRHSARRRPQLFGVLRGVCVCLSCSCCAFFAGPKCQKQQIWAHCCTDCLLPLRCVRCRAPAPSHPVTLSLSPSHSVLHAVLADLAFCPSARKGARTGEQADSRHTWTALDMQHHQQAASAKQRAAEKFLLRPGGSRHSRPPSRPGLRARGTRGRSSPTSPSASPWT